MKNFSIFYGKNRPFDGGNAIVKEIQQLRRKIARAGSERRRETLRIQEKCRLTELCEQLDGLIGKAGNLCYQALGRYVGYSEQEDMVNEAFVAVLSKAIDRFDETQGAKFSTFAYDCARGGCVDKINRQDHDARKKGTKPKVVFLSHDTLAENGQASYEDPDPGDREFFDHINSLSPCDREILDVLAGMMTMTEYLSRWDCTKYMSKKHMEEVRGYYRAWAEGERHLPKNVRWNRFAPRKAAAAGDRLSGGQHGPDVSRKLEGSRIQAA